MFFFVHSSLDNKSAGRQSVASNLTKPDHEDDADSMAEYGEGDTGKFSRFAPVDYTEVISPPFLLRFCMCMHRTHFIINCEIFVFINIFVLKKIIC